MSKQPPPIFVVGHPRSGSTLLASQLGRHPNIAALPETHFFDSSYAGMFTARARATRSLDALLDWTLERNIRIHDLKLAREEVAGRVADGGELTIKAVLDAVLAITREQSGKGRVLEKTPRHIEHIDRILDWYPQARIICILRDSRDAIQSLIDAKWTHSDPRRHALFWNWSVAEGLRQQARHPQSVLVVRYEDLLGDHEATLQRILEFVGEDSDLGFLATASSPETIPEWERDWKSKAGAAIDPSMAYKWRRDPAPRHVRWTAWTERGLERLGHGTEVPGFPTAGILSRLKAGSLQAGYAVFYRLWCLYRTHFSDRQHRYRAQQLPAGKAGEAQR